MALPQSASVAVFGQLRSIVAAPETRIRRARQAAQVICDVRAFRWVGLYDVTPSEIVALAWSGPEEPAFLRFPVGAGLNGAAVRSGQPVVVQERQRRSALY